MIISLPAAYLLFSHSIVQLPLNISFKKILLIVLVFIFLFHLIIKTKYYTTPSKPQFREAAEYIIKKEAENNSVPFIICFSWSEYMFEYYFNKAGSDFHVDALLGEKDDVDSLMTLFESNDLDYFWYLSAHRVPGKEFLDFLDHAFEVTERKELVQASIMLCQKNRN